MRQKRAKTYKRVMALYTQTFGFRTPFQMLVSQDILLKCPPELNLAKALQACVQAETKFMITQCCVEALYKLGKEYQQVTNLAKTFERRRCNHREAIEPDACLKDVVGPTNKHNYILAAQSVTLRQSVSNVPGLPIIHFNPRAVLVLSPPSVATTRHKNEVEEKRRLESERGMEGVVDGENVIGPSSVAGPSSTFSSATAAAARGGRKKLKGPNPLSVKRKKVEKRPREAEQREQDEDERHGPLQDSVVDGDGEAETEADSSKRRKKRKRGRGKGAVAEARAELAADMGAGRSDGGASDGGD